MFFSVTLCISAASALYSGSCGTGITWSLDASSGVLTISGNGEMNDFYDERTLPWYNVRTSIKRAVLSDGVTKLGSGAFAGCTELKEVVLGDSVAIIGNNSFDSCSSFTTFELSCENTALCVLDGVLFNKNMTKLISYPAGKAGNTYSIPSGVKTVSYSAFAECVNLRTLTLPDNLVMNGYNAFTNCRSLVSFAVGADSKNFSVIDGVLFNKDKTVLVSYPAGKSQSVYSVPDGVTEIGNSAFWHCSSLADINFPEGLEIINECAFTSCTSLYMVTFPAGIEMINSYAFQSCRSLSAVTFLGDAPQINTNAFISTSKGFSIWYYSSGTGWTAPSWTSSGGNSYKTVCLGAVPGDTPVTVASGICGNVLAWSLDNAGELKISGSGAMNDYQSYGTTAPWTGMPLKKVTVSEGVTSIGTNAFYNSPFLSQVNLPQSLKTIGNFSFAYCPLLTGIDISGGVDDIGTWAFRNCSSLSAINVGDGDGAYSSKDGILFSKDKTTLFCYPSGKTATEYTVPGGVKTLSHGAFLNCTSLSSITLPDGLEKCMNSVFSGCSSLTSLDLPDSLLSIGGSSFNDCTSLVSVNAGDENVSFCSVNGILFNKNMTSLICYPAGKTDAEYYIPSGVSEVGFNAFNCCAALVTVTIPESVSVFYSSVFSGCTSLTSVIFRGNAYVPTQSWQSAVSDLFDSDAAYPTLYYYNGASGWTSPTWRDTNGISFNCVCLGVKPAAPLTVIASGSCGDDVAWKLYSNNELVISGDGAMNNMQGIWPWSGRTVEKITVSEGVTVIGRGAFEVCGLISDVSLPSTLLSIDEYAFAGCGELVSIDIPDNVGYIADNVFYNCPSLVSVNVGAGNVKYSSEDGILFSKDKTELLLYPAGRAAVNYIIPDGVRLVNSGSFRGCSALGTVSFPGSVVIIMPGTFSGCTSLTAINVAASNTAFCSLDGVLYTKEVSEIICYPAARTATEYTVPESVVTINYAAFEDCASLTAVTLAGNIELMPYNTFGNCSSLKSVTFFGDAPVIYSDAFRNIPAGIILYYYSGNSGWTSPTWTSYDGEIFDTVCLGAAPKHGFVSGGGITQYYTNGSYVTGWQSIGGDIYYFIKSTGAMVTGDKSIGGTLYRFGDDGRFTGISKGTYGVRFYSGVIPEGSNYSTGWKNVDGSIYYFVSSTGGFAATGDKSIGGNTYSFDENGVFTGWMTNGAGLKRYYPGSVIPQGRTYITGWMYIDGSWYYFVSSNSGYAAVGNKTVGGISYSFDADGKLTSELKNGFVSEDGGIRYYKNGVRQTGWQEIGSDRYYFFVSSGKMLNYSRFVGGVWCKFDGDGKYIEPLNGFITSGDGTRYYRNDNYLTGWKQIDGYWYYFYVSSGLMVTESRVIGGTWYEVAPDGKVTR